MSHSYLCKAGNNAERQLCANLLIPNCLRSNLSYSPLAALELYVKNPKSAFFLLFYSFTSLLLEANIIQVTSAKNLILEIRILENAPFHRSAQPKNHKN